jgi:hypothetical protein
VTTQDTKDALSTPIGEYIAELEKDPVWKADLDLARKESMTDTQLPSKERVNLYEATRAFRDQHYSREHREPEPTDYFRAGASWERAAHEPCVHPWENIGVSQDGHPFCAACVTNLVEDPPWSTPPPGVRYSKQVTVHGTPDADLKIPDAECFTALNLGGHTQAVLVVTKMRDGSPVPPYAQEFIDFVVAHSGPTKCDEAT